MNRMLLVVAIVVTTLFTALLDLRTSAELMGSILFTLPLALCAMQRSKRLLWCIAAAVILLTILPEFWGISRGELKNPLVASVNRGLLIASLITLTVLIHCWINQSQKLIVNGVEIERQRIDLSIQNGRLEAMVASAISDANIHKLAEEHVGHLESGRQLMEESLRQSEERYRVLLDGIQNYAIFVMDLHGDIISWNAGAERIKGYRADEIIGRNFSCFFPSVEIERGRPAEVLRMTAANGQHEEQCMRIRKDGSRFLADVALTALRDPAGNLLGFSEFSHDLSESKESGAKYRGLLEAAPDAMVVVNQSGEIVLLNLQAEKQFGYYRDELLGQKVKNIIPEGFAERLVADGSRSAAEALAQQIGMGIELYGRRKDGTQFPIEIMLSPLENAEGILITAAIRDISVRKAAESKLLSQTDRLSLATQIASLGVWEFDLTQGLSWDAKMFEIYGLTPVKGSIPYEIWSTAVFAEDLPLAEATLNRVVREKNQGSAEFRITKADGSIRNVSAVEKAVLDDRGNVARVIGINMDITERKQAEEDLRQSEERLRSIVSNAKDYAILMLDPDGNVVNWNEGAERMKGYRADEIIGQNFSRFYSAEDARNGKPAAALEEAGRVGRFEAEGWRIRKDGSKFFANVVISALRDESGLLRGFGKITRDITERRKAEEHMVKTAEELRQSNDQLQQFAYVASHDLQEPLRMVASYTQLLAKRYKGQLDSDADEFIDYAVDGCSRMQGLIQDLLAYSRSGSDHKPVREISGEAALEGALTNLRATIEESSGVVTHDALPTLMSDDTQLTMVFQNLIGNAIKYRGADPPRVHVSATRNGGNEWTFSVRDNGLGIEAEYFERIFVLFQRLHGRNEFQGTGIGLAICKKTVERLGGRIWVESQPEKGSTFFFSLPAGGGK